MARLNLTIPDALYERLERLRDRVNVSKICATALTKELEMLEGVSTVGGDTKVQRLVERFLRQKERWYRRGRQDGEVWAMERASLDELQRMEEEWEEWNEEELPDYESLDDVELDEFPSCNVRHCLKQWASTDRSEGITEEPDWRSYFQGWYHGARDLWIQAKPSLRVQR